MKGISDFFAGNMVVVFFLYGLAWFGMALAVMLEIRKAERSPLSDSFRFLAIFGFLHALVEWTDMFALVPDSAVLFQNFPHFRTAKTLLLGISACFLLLFGVKLITGLTKQHAWLQLLPLILFLGWLITPWLLASMTITGMPGIPAGKTTCFQCHADGARALIQQSSSTLSITAIWDIFARYLIYLPGLLISAIAVYLQSKEFQKRGLLTIKRDSWVLSGALAANGFFAGLVVTPASFFPADSLNYHTFVIATRTPPQVFRAAFALIIAYAVVRVLNVFHIEYIRSLEVARRTRFQAQLSALEEVGRLKTEFVSTVSHELRTPLNAIIGFSDLLLEENYGTLNAKQKRQVDNIFTSGRHLLQLVDDILDISKIDAGKMELHKEKFDLVVALNAAASLARNLANGKQLEISVRSPKGMTSVNADLLRFNQVLYNLLSNAVKFTPPGGRIRIESEDKGCYWEIGVADTGIGIAPQDLERIFEPFQQVDSSLTRQYCGTGLGLPLTRKLVETLGGRIWVESEPGLGSTFRFTLPLDG